MEADRRGEAPTATFLKSWVKRYGVTYPIASDGARLMLKYVQAYRGIPSASLLIRLDTMKLVSSRGGSSSVSQVNQLVKTLP